MHTLKDISLKSNVEGWFAKTKGYQNNQEINLSI